MTDENDGFFTPHSNWARVIQTPHSGVVLEPERRLWICVFSFESVNDNGRTF